VVPRYEPTVAASMNGSLRVAVSQSMSHRRSPSKSRLNSFGSLWAETKVSGRHG
jgi:hypothetical protein